MRYFLTAICCLAIQMGFSQELRVSQYQAIPQLVNPSFTGDFVADGRFRFSGLYANMFSDSAGNSYRNFSFDTRFGKENQWAIGANYLGSADERFPVSVNIYALSLAKNFSLDRLKTHNFRVGVQAAYFNGIYDGSKGNYDVWLDANIFLRYNIDPNIDLNSFQGRAAYWNLSYGFKYSFVVDRFSFETSVSAYNVNNPLTGYDLLGHPCAKRYRVNALTSFQYAYDPLNTFRLEHFSWKEGIFLRSYEIGIDDYPEIHETTYSLQWLRTKKRYPWTLGFYSRSWKAVSAHFSLGITKSANLRLSYEEPLFRKYYSPGQLNLGVTYIPRNKKAQKVKVAPDLDKNLLAAMPFGTRLNNCENEIAAVNEKAVKLKDSLKAVLADMSYQLYLMKAKSDSCCSLAQELIKPSFRPDLIEADTCNIGDIGSIVLSTNRTLSADAKIILASFAKKIKDNPNCFVKITNTATLTKASRQYSWERVNIVAKYLIEKLGVSETRIVFNYGVLGEDSNIVSISGTSRKGPIRPSAPAPFLRDRQRVRTNN